MNKRAIKNRVRERDNGLWREELENLSSVEVYSGLGLFWTLLHKYIYIVLNKLIPLNVK